MTRTENVTEILEKWLEGLYNDYELVFILMKFNINGRIDEGRYVGYDYVNQEWVTVTKMKYALEKIDNDNRRPGMPAHGWLVRYDLSEYAGWRRCKVCASKEEAEAFIITIETE